MNRFVLFLAKVLCLTILANIQFKCFKNANFDVNDQQLCSGNCKNRQFARITVRKYDADARGIRRTAWSSSNSFQTIDEIKKIQKLRKCGYRINSLKVSQSGDTCILLLTKQRQKDFLQKIITDYRDRRRGLTTKSGLCMIILNEIMHDRPFDINKTKHLLNRIL